MGCNSLLVVYEATLKLVLEGLEESRGRWPEIARATDVPYHTLTKIAQRQIENPGVTHIQKLADYFNRQATHA